MDMPVETLELLISTAQEAKAVTSAKLDRFERGQAIITKPDGTFAELTLIPARSHKLGSVSELPEFIKYQKEARQADPVVFLAPNLIHIVLNDSTSSVRDDKATCSLSYTERFSELRGLSQGTIDQKSLIRLLKVTFEGQICESGKTLLKQVRKLSRSNDQQSSRSGTVVHEIVTATGDEFPTQITISTTVFNDSALKTKHAVTVQVEVNPETATFELIPSDIDLTRAIDDSLNEIKTLLGGCACPVFLGAP